jgi:hypothetical protein
MLTKTTQTLVIYSRQTLELNLKHRRKAIFRVGFKSLNCHVYVLRGDVHSTSRKYFAQKNTIYVGVCRKLNLLTI